MQTQSADSKSDSNPARTEKPICVGWNGRFLLQPYTGIGRYTVNLLLAMAKQDQSMEFVIGVPDKIAAQKTIVENFKETDESSIQIVNNPILKTAQCNQPPNIRLIEIPLIKQIPTTSLRNFFWEQIQLPRALKKSGAAIIHYPYPSNPRFGGFAKPGYNPPKTIVTVHDVIPWSRQEYRKKLRTRLYQKNAQSALKDVDAIIAVSEATAMDLTDKINFPYDCVKIIHEAASPMFKMEGKKHSHTRATANADIPSRDNAPSKDYPLPATDFLLYMGGYDPRKNVTRLVEAFAEYIARNYETDLVLVGADEAMRTLAKDKNSLIESLPERTIKNLQQTFATRKSGSMIFTTPSLPQEILAEYLRGARAIINVSLSEGFNLPLLEAAACGTPILTSDLQVHREILGENALFCDPSSTKSIGEMLVNFLRDNELQQKLRAKTRILREKYTWENSARKTLALYKSLIA